LRTSVAFQRWVLLAAVLLVASAFAGVESAFGAWRTVADWEMNEQSTDAAIMHDSSGNGRYGLIGDAVVTGVIDPDFGNPANRAYEWPAPAPSDVKDPQRLVRVDRRAMNPRRDPFAVTIRLKTSVLDANIIQKGQAGTAGGMWKIEVTGGSAICLFRGSAGRRAIGSGSHLVSDNEWHTVRCERRRGSVSIVVDGVRRTQDGRTGRIANTWALVIGGKSVCNPPNNSCQYYEGRLDRAVVRRG
jgi:Laminin G domain